VLAGFIVPLALVGHSRSARAGQTRPADGLTVESNGGVAAPTVLAAAADREVRVGVEVAALTRAAVLEPASSTTTTGPSTSTTAFVPPSSTPSPSGGLPVRLMAAIVAANRIARLPYIWGGGHGSFDAAGYDCSGSVSYVLHAALVLATPEDSTGLESYGDPGPGRWITVYANATHAFMTLGGLRYDTVGLSATGSRWQTLGPVPAGYVVRHPVGL